MGLIHGQGAEFTTDSCVAVWLHVEPLVASSLPGAGLGCGLPVQDVLPFAWILQSNSTADLAFVFA